MDSLLVYVCVMVHQIMAYKLLLSWGCKRFWYVPVPGVGSALTSDERQTFCSVEPFESIFWSDCELSFAPLSRYDTPLYDTETESSLFSQSFLSSYFCCGYLFNNWPGLQHDMRQKITAVRFDSPAVPFCCCSTETTAAAAYRLSISMIQQEVIVSSSLLSSKVRTDQDTHMTCMFPPWWILTGRREEPMHVSCYADRENRLSTYVSSVCTLLPLFLLSGLNDWRVNTWREKRMSPGFAKTWDINTHPSFSVCHFSVTSDSLYIPSWKLFLPGR